MICISNQLVGFLMARVFTKGYFQNDYDKFTVSLSPSLPFYIQA